MVEGICQRKHAPQRDAPVRGLEARQATSGRRIADRAPGIGSEREGRKARCYGDARATRRDARPALRVPGVHGGRHARVMNGECPLGHLDLSEHDRARRLETIDDLGVLASRTITERRRPRARRLPGDIAQILQRDGHTMQHAKRLPGARDRIELGRTLARALGPQDREGLELRVEARDPLERRLADLEGAETAFGLLALEVFDTEPGDLVLVHAAGLPVGSCHSGRLQVGRVPRSRRGGRRVGRTLGSHSSKSAPPPS